MKIKIWKTDQGGYMYDIWLDEDADETEGSDDGGHCECTYQEAVDIACKHAVEMLNSKEGL